MRQDYIEPEYINGVYNSKGEQVIRPLNNKEKQFLNKFYEEVVCANFTHSPRLKQLSKEIRHIKKIETPSEEELEKLMELQMEYFMAADDSLLYSDEDNQRRLYGENNARNRCLYNRSKSIGMLDELNDSTYDEIHNKVYNNPEIADQLLLSKVESKKPKTILRKKKKSKNNQKA